MHIHVNALDFLVTLAYMVIGSFMLRSISYTWPDSKVGKALASFT